VRARESLARTLSPSISARRPVFATFFLGWELLTARGGHLQFGTGVLVNTRHGTCDERRANCGLVVLPGALLRAGFGT